MYRSPGIPKLSLGSAFLISILLLSSCGGGGSTAQTNPVQPGNSASLSVPQVGHVVVVVFENQDYAQIAGSSSMPYLNGLASRYGLATNYFANTHPSIGDYFMMTTGQIISNDDAFSGTVSADNIARVMSGAGLSWKVYAEGLPSVGYTGGDQYPYVKRHNPFAYFSDVLNSSTEAANLVPFGKFSGDLSGGGLPRYSFVVPNNQNNTHDCPAGMQNCTLADKLQNADNWLKANIDPLVNSGAFADTLLIITFDEAAVDNSNGGGKIFTMIAGGAVKGGARSTTFYQHQSLLQLTLAAMGQNHFPGAAASAAGMGEFFH